MGYLIQRRRKQRERALIITLLVVLSTLSLVGLFDSWNWQFDYVGEYRLQYAVLAAMLCAFCSLRQRWSAFLVAVIVLIMNVSLMASHVSLSEPKPIGSSVESFRLLTHNMGAKNLHLEEIVDSIRNNGADIVVLHEISTKSLSIIDILGNDYPYKLASVASNNNEDNEKIISSIILSKIPWQEQGQVEGGYGLWVTFDIKGRELTIATTKMESPWSFDGFYKAKKQVSNLVSFVRERDEPVVLVGNMGATPWARILRALELEAGLSVRERLLPTRYAYYPWVMRLPVDHIYAHPGIDIRNTHLAYRANSDHYAISAEIHLLETEFKQK